MCLCGIFVISLQCIYDLLIYISISLWILIVFSKPKSVLAKKRKYIFIKVNKENLKLFL